MKKIGLISLVLFSSLNLAQAQNETLESVKDYKKNSHLSTDAAKYYAYIQQNGWSAIVAEFENGHIANSKMKKAEIKKICDVALMQNNLDHVKRLMNAGCTPSDKNLSFNMINSAIKTSHAEIDQQEMIKKLQFFNDKGLLKYQMSYGRGYWATTATLHTAAVAYGLNQVFDYLNTLNIKIKHNDSNLLTVHFNGSNPNLEMTQKLLNLGYTLDHAAYQIMLKKNFEVSHPEIYAVFKTAIASSQSQ